MNIKLSAPSPVVFVISVALAAVVVLGRLGIFIPTFGMSSFTVLVIAYAVLLIGVLVKEA